MQQAGDPAPHQTRCSFWLLPASRRRARLAALIASLTEWPFDPHVTLYAGTMAEAEACAIARNLARNFAPVELLADAAQPESTERFSKTLFVQYRYSPRLNAMYEYVKARCAGQDYRLNPHLSLCYKTMSPEDRLELRNGPQVPTGRYSFTAVRVVDTGQAFGKPEQVKEWRGLAEYDLGGYALAEVWSGGQTGVDQGALGAAMQAGIVCSGYCPPGGVCEDDGRNGGKIPPEILARLTITDRSEHPEAPGIERSWRTRLNVENTDATLILRRPRVAIDTSDPGTELSEAWAKRLQSIPPLSCDPGAASSAARILRWLASYPILRLNVAGPSEAAADGIGLETRKLLSKVFRAISSGGID